MTLSKFVPPLHFFLWEPSRKYGVLSIMSHEKIVRSSIIPIEYVLNGLPTNFFAETTSSISMMAFSSGSSIRGG